MGVPSNQFDFWHKSWVGHFLRERIAFQHWRFTHVSSRQKVPLVNGNMVTLGRWMFCVLQRQPGYLCNKPTFGSEWLVFFWLLGNWVSRLTVRWPKNRQTRVTFQTHSCFQFKRIKQTNQNHQNYFHQNASLVPVISKHFSTPNQWPTSGTPHHSLLRRMSAGSIFPTWSIRRKFLSFPRWLFCWVSVCLQTKTKFMEVWCILTCPKLPLWAFFSRYVYHCKLGFDSNSNEDTHLLVHRIATTEPARICTASPASLRASMITSWAWHLEVSKKFDRFDTFSHDSETRGLSKSIKHSNYNNQIDVNFDVPTNHTSPNSVAHWGVLTVRVKPLRSRCKFLSPSFFTAQGHKKRDSGGQNLRFACAKRWLGKFFGVSL